MDMHHAETFVKVVELRSFTKAAEELYLTQPTVSKQIVDLERFFQVKLIDRTRRSVALTKAGELFFKYAKEIVALKKDTIEAMAAFRGLKSGGLRLGASTIPGVYILPSVMKAFKERFPMVNLSLAVSDSKNITSDVENSALDVGFVGSKDETARVVYRSFLEDSIVCAAPPAFPATLTTESLKNHDLLMREPGSGTRQCFEAALKKKGLRVQDLKVAGELGDTEAIKAAIKEGMGLSYVSRRAIKDDVDRGLLKVVDVKGLSAVKRHFYIITKRGRTASPHVEALFDTIRKWRQHEDA
jgi:DNA-binding transcriptional LysR family regulator